MLSGLYTEREGLKREREREREKERWGKGGGVDSVDWRSLSSKFNSSHTDDDLCRDTDR